MMSEFTICLCLVCADYGLWRSARLSSLLWALRWELTVSTLARVWPYLLLGLSDDADQGWHYRMPSWSQECRRARWSRRIAQEFSRFWMFFVTHSGPVDASARLCETCGDQEHPAVLCCLECKEDMCQVAAQFHARLKLSRDHRLVSFAELEAKPHLSAAPVFCAEHSEPFRYFDEKCGRLICRDCFALKHNGHKCCSLSEAASKSRKEIKSLALKANTAAGRVKAAGERVMSIHRDLDHKRDQAVAKIDAVFEEVCAVACISLSYLSHVDFSRQIVWFSQKKS